jgi:carbamoyltransferase
VIRTVLGLWDGHEASVALLVDGALAFALSEERPSRRKRHSGFPVRALARCLAWAAARGLAIDAVALAGHDGRAPLRLLEPLYARSEPHRDTGSALSRLVRGWENRLPRLPAVRAAERALGRAAVAARLRPALGTRVPLHTVPHHEAHAFSALFGPRRDGALVVTWDAYGEGLAATVRRADAPAAALVARGPDLGLAELYGAVTQALGFREGDEGKVMGLAARGRPAVARDRLRALFAAGPDAPDGPRLRRPARPAAVRRLLAGVSRDDAAAALQALAEELAADWVGAALRVHGGGRPRPLLLAGGLFANIRVNQALAALPAADGVFVFPNMGDGGLSAGAAHRVWWAATGALAAPLEHALLGCAFDPVPALAAARARGLTLRRPADQAAAAAAHLRAGRVVCRHDGRDEFGPRALGNRSILFAADRPGLGERVNAALRRDDFMPFGPLIREEEARRAWPEGGRGPSCRDLAYMTVSAAADPALARAAPTAVHLDGTTRPQVVAAATTPALHRLLTAYVEGGGAPAVINTSFNLHGEPIVHTPEDALATFLTSGLDVLFLGDHEVLAGPESGRTP